MVICENGLIRKIRLILKFKTSQPGKQTITIHILPKIARSKGNQKMKLGQLLECNLRNHKYHTENEAERLVPNFFLFYSKKLYMRYEIKVSGLRLGFNIIR